VCLEQALQLLKAAGPLSAYSGQAGFDQPTDISGFVVPQIWPSPVIKTRRRQTHEFNFVFYISNQWSR